MDNTRRVCQPTHPAWNAANPGCRNGSSERSLKRVLSVDAVIDDMRAILWPDRCDEECPDPDTDFVCEDGAQSSACLPRAPRT